MSELEFVGKIDCRSFISLATEEKIQIEEIKQRILRQKIKKVFIQEQSEFIYERDVINDYE